jgi:hypothetical protein
MTNILLNLTQRVQQEDGFVIGRVALVILILAIVVVAALLALIVPN